MKPLRRLAVVFAAVALVAGPARSTWSICVVNTRTGEACVASATCLSNFNLKLALPVMRPGLGCASSQASVDSSGANRIAIYNGLGAGAEPSKILTHLLTLSGAQTRQFGIVDFDHDPVTFTGNQTFLANPGLAGVSGDLKYAIQGNILVGAAPVYEAELALLNTPGDLSQKVMAAMEAARAWGGDGRCSCSNSQPTSCGVPPPEPFKSAHVGFVLLSRLGDSGGQQCGASTGCATGELYLNLNVIGSTIDPDPVFTLQAQYAQWRAALADRPDHILSRVSTDATALVADGRSKSTVTVRLRDVEDVPLTHGGAAVTLSQVSGQPSVTTASAAVDNGDGTYSFTLSAGTSTGKDAWRIVVDDGVNDVRLHPDLYVRVDPVTPLHVGHDQISASASPSVQIVVNAGAAGARRPYLLLASNAGTAPGLPFAGTLLPLNSSSLLTYTYLNPNSGALPGTFGKLDRTGRAEAHFLPDPSLLVQLAGTRVDWSGVVFDPQGSTALAPAGFDVLP
jgi:hypothetical protein